MLQLEMLKTVSKITLFFLAFALSGCATTIPYEASKNLVPQDSRASIVVYWHQESKSSSTALSSITNLFGMDRMEVMLDDKVVGVMRPNTHAVLGIKKGARTLKLHVVKSNHDDGVSDAVNLSVGEEVVFDIETDTVPSATTHYESGYWDDSCNCMIGDGDVPDYTYSRYDLRKVAAMPTEGLRSGRDIMYIEP